MSAVIAHEHQRVLPGSGILIVHVVDGLVHHYPGLFGGRHGHSANRQIRFAVGIFTIGGGQLLTVVEQRVEIVRHIALDGIERVLAFVTQQMIRGALLPSVARQHAVVPQPVAHQQQITGLLPHGRSTVVEHFQIAFVGRSIGRAARKLIIQLVGSYDFDAQTILLLMKTLKSYGLFPQLPRLGNDDNHVDNAIAMQVLISYRPHILGRWERTGELGRGHRFIPSHRHIIEAHRTA